MRALLSLVAGLLLAGAAALAQGTPGDATGSDRSAPSAVDPDGSGPSPRQPERPTEEQSTSQLPEADQRSAEQPRDEDGEVSLVPGGQTQTPLSGTTTADLLGREVVNRAGQAVGPIQDLVIDPQDGEVTHVVVGVGPYLGAGDRSVAVPWSDVEVNTDAIVTSLSRDELARAEPYSRGRITPQQAEGR